MVVAQIGRATVEICAFCNDPEQSTGAWGVRAVLRFRREASESSILYRLDTFLKHLGCYVLCSSNSTRGLVVKTPWGRNETNFKTRRPERWRRCTPETLSAACLHHTSPLQYPT